MCVKQFWRDNHEWHTLIQTSSCIVHHYFILRVENFKCDKYLFEYIRALQNKRARIRKTYAKSVSVVSIEVSADARAWWINLAGIVWVLVGRSILSPQAILEFEFDLNGSFKKSQINETQLTVE